MLTLWDLLTPKALRRPPGRPPAHPLARPPVSPPAHPAAPPPTQRPGPEAVLPGPGLAAAPNGRSGRARAAAREGGEARGGSAAERYLAMERTMLARHGVRVRKWRTAMSGCAWTVSYADGRTSRLIESPRPRGPVSAAIFLHEVGHHVIGLGRFKPRCLEEYYAWAYSIAQLRAWGVAITPRVLERVRLSLEYAVGKAARRGMKAIPAELTAYRAVARDPEAAVLMLVASGAFEAG